MAQQDKEMLLKGDFTVQVGTMSCLFNDGPCFDNGTSVTLKKKTQEEIRSISNISREIIWRRLISVCGHTLTYGAQVYMKLTS